MSFYPIAHLHLPFLALFLIVGVFYLLRTFFFAGGAAFFIESFSSLFRRKIEQAPLHRRQLFSEVKSAAWIILFDVCFSTLLLYFNLFKHTNDSLPVFAVTFVIMFVWFEIWFYVTHRILHHRKLYFIHIQHHLPRVTNPLTSLTFSLAERTVLLVGGIGFPVLLSYVMPLSFLGYVSYFSLNYVLTVFAHSNVEIVPLRLVKNPVVFLNSPTFHSLHHARQTGHYGLFTPYLDRLFKSHFSDYDAVHEKCHQGLGLKRSGKSH
jgi:lathosterol oxidase